MSHPDLLIHQLLRTAKLTRDRLRQDLNAVGLHRGQGHVMCIVGYDEGIAQRDLAQVMHVSPATLCCMLQRMEEARLIVRRHGPEDERALRVFLTEHGREVFARCEQAWQSINSDLIDCFQPEEEVILRRFLVTLQEHLSDHILEDSTCTDALSPLADE